MNGDKTKDVFYASVGPQLYFYDIDLEGASLHKRGAVTLPANIQYVWPHPSRRYLYVVSSNGGPRLAGDTHRASALTIEPGTGALRPHGRDVPLPSRPIHSSVDAHGQYLLVAYNNPSGITVHKLNGDGTIGLEIAQSEKLDTGIYAHQVLTTPSNKFMTLVTRGNDPKPGKGEDPGAIHTFSFADGELRNLASIAPAEGLGFGPRHLDFHPTKPWAFVSIERQNKLYVYKLDHDTGLANTPMFVKDTLSNPTPTVRQAAGAIHVHPNGKFVYVTNRASDLIENGGQQVFPGGENNVAVFAIDQSSGEPTLIQNADGCAVELRTFGIDSSGRLLVAASIKPVLVHGADGIKTMPAKLSVFQIGSDGRLELKRQYNIDTGNHQQFWSGMVKLA